MLRINLNIAIVSMVPAKPPKAGHLSSECLVPTTNTNTSKNGTLTTVIFKLEKWTVFALCLIFTIAAKRVQRASRSFGAF